MDMDDKEEIAALGCIVTADVKHEINSGSSLIANPPESMEVESCESVEKREQMLQCLIC